MAFNLPPGCSVNDIPGNSIEDEMFDNWVDENQDELEGMSEKDIYELFRNSQQVWLEPDICDY
jgi:hypothetical protein